jgi:predicted small metal-binding protein
MAKFLRCTDIIPGCDFVARGETGDEAVARAIEHVRTRHHLRAISPEILAYLVSAVRDERARAASASSAA